MSNQGVSGISVVIPNYNGRHLFPEILPPLFLALQDSGLPFEVIVSDDHSTDDSISFLQTNYPLIKLLQSEKNLGFSPTINKGIFIATHSHILLLNSDVKLTRNYFNGLLHYFEKVDTFGVMSRIVGWENDTIQDGGKYPSFHGLKIKTSGNYVPDKNESCGWLYSMYLSGANAFVDREKICVLQGFNEMFAPFYIEDYELSVRAWRSGWKCYYDHDTICRHQESRTIKSKAKKNKIREIYYRNKMYLHALHLPKTLLPLWHLQLLAECVVNSLMFRLYYVRAIFQYFDHLSLLYIKRKEFKALAEKIRQPQLSLKEVTDFVSDDIIQHKVTIIK